MAKNLKAALIAAIESKSARSTWDRATKIYAAEVIEAAELDNVQTIADLKKEILGGAESWKEYSYGGCSLIYDSDIAARVCTPSELRAKRGGELQPSRRENWLDVQTRALGHAARRIVAAFEAFRKGAKK